jgi:hypothetical protein
MQHRVADLGRGGAATPETCGHAMDVPEIVLCRSSGQVLSTCTPGAARATLSFFCDNPATALLLSIAATEMTPSYLSGYDRLSSPSFPAGNEYSLFK